MGKKIKSLGIALVFVLSLGAFAPGAFAQSFAFGLRNLNIGSQLRGIGTAQMMGHQRSQVRGVSNAGNNIGRVISDFTREHARHTNQIGRIISQFVRGIIASPSL